MRVEVKYIYNDSEIRNALYKIKHCDEIDEDDLMAIISGAEQWLEYRDSNINPREESFANGWIYG